MMRPNKAAEMTTPLVLQQPTIRKVNGVNVKKYTDIPGVMMANFATYGGTEQIVNGVLSIIDTATVTCWYNPEITAGCRVKRLPDNAVYEIMGEPENIEMRNMFLVFKVRRVKGGA